MIVLVVDVKLHATAGVSLGGADDRVRLSGVQMDLERRIPARVERLALDVSTFGGRQ